MTYRRIHMWFIISSITAGTGLLLTLMFGLMLGQARKGNRERWGDMSKLREALQ